jgi:indolepyruvate ferredoxin oxidoreductase, alpha subunit
VSIIEGRVGGRYLLMGNEAIARGALEAGVTVAAGYPGTPSSEIIESLAKVSEELGLYVEWSANEKVAMEVSAAASFAGLRSLVSMKQNGLSVALDFMLHLALSGTRGGMVVVPCEDPGAISSIDETETRYLARLMEIPILEPGDFQEAKDMVTWAFELSEEIKNIVMVRSVTRLSHASGIVGFGEITEAKKEARFRCDGNFFDPVAGPILPVPVDFKHGQQQARLGRAVELFEDSPFNTYTGPDNPRLLIIAGSVCQLYAREAIDLLGLESEVGLLKLGTTWPLPPRLIERYLSSTDKILIVDEVLPFLEENIKVLALELIPRIGVKTFYGKRDGTLPMTGELNPDIVTAALAGIMGVTYEAVAPEYAARAMEISITGAPYRELTFCPGCPHRASFWSIATTLKTDGRDGFVCGDIGCYGMAILPCGFSVSKVVHAMGSGTGVASGFGKLREFGMEQPVLSVCGDSTFFASALPALFNAVHHRSDITMVVLDNSGTAMTGFQPHPGLTVDAAGHEALGVDIAAVCRSIGAKVALSDPFDLAGTQETLLGLLGEPGVKVLVLKQACSLSPEKKGKRPYEMSVDGGVCFGESCGCNRLCTRIFRCPGLVWDKERKAARIDEVICTGCGVCGSICPSGAIVKQEVA